MVLSMIVTLTPNSTAKRMPAMAPAIGVAARRSTLAALMSRGAGWFIRHSTQ